MAMTPNDITDLITLVENGEYPIDDALADIAKASRGELVRAAIYAALLNCYNDGKAGSGADLLARAKLEALESSKASVADFSALSKQTRSLMAASHVIKSGMTDVVTVEAGSYVDIPVTFGHTYTSPPRVVATISGGSTSVNYGLLTLTVPNGSITTTGCTLRLFNRHTALFQPRVVWAAIGDTAEDAADLLASVIDDALSATSQNAVSNAAVTAAINSLSSNVVVQIDREMTLAEIEQLNTGLYRFTVRNRFICSSGNVDIVNVDIVGVCAVKNNGAGNATSVTVLSPLGQIIILDGEITGFIDLSEVSEAIKSVSSSGISASSALIGQVPVADGVGGWSWENQQAAGAVTTKQIGKKIVSGEITKIVLLGDSITHGTGGSGYGTDSSNPDGYCWANAFKKFVSETYGATVAVMGYFGSVASLQVQNALKALTGKELVVWLSGTNNRDTKEGFESYQTNIGSYIAQLQANSAALLVMGCCPASAADDAQYYKTTWDMNNVLMSKAYGIVPYISMYQEYADACAAKKLTVAETLSDGLHPNDSGHQIIFEVLCREIGLLLNANVDYSYSGAWWGGSLSDGPSYEYPFPASYSLSGQTFIGVNDNQNWLINYPVPAGKVVEMKINSWAEGTYNLYFARVSGTTAAIIKAVPVTLVSGLNTLTLDIDLEESCYFVADGYARFYDSSDATHHARLPNGDLVEGSEYAMTMDAADMIDFALWMKVQVTSE